MKADARRSRTGLVVLALLGLATLLAWLSRISTTSGGDAAVLGAREASPDEAVVLPAIDAQMQPEGLAGDSLLAPAAPGATATSTPPSTRLVVRVTWEHDGTPAEDIVLSVLFWDELDPSPRDAASGRTDGQGLWALEPAPAGKVTAYSDRARSVSGDVRAGETTELVLSIPPGTLVRGVVLGPEGQPMPDADIWLSAYGSQTEGAVVSRSGEDGRFVLRDIAPWRSLGARAAGHVPSALVQLGEQPPPELDVELVLGAAGATLLGLVVDEHDAPIDDAFVVVGPEHGFPGPDLRRGGAGPPPLKLRTTEDGRFMAADLLPGTIPVGVVAAGHSPWTGWRKVDAGESIDLRIELEPSAQIEGTVRDGDGAPVAGAGISAGPRYGDIGWVVTESDATGHFLLRDLPLGQPQVVASKKGLGEDKRTFHVFGGRSYAWDPVLTPGLQILGRLVDESGVSVEGLRIECAHARQADVWRKTATVAADGSFILPNCDDVEHVLTVFRQDWSFPSLVSVTGVRPGPEEVRVVLPVGARSFATVVGRAITAAGRPPLELHAGLMPVGQPMGLSGRVDDATGGFEFAEVPMGDYELSLSSADDSSLRLPVLAVRGGERRDLGTLLLPEPGVVVAKLVLAPGLQEQQVYCSLQSADGRFGTPSFEGREEGPLERRSGPVPPGDWVLHAAGRYALPVSLPVRVESGRETRVDVALEKGVRQVLRFVMPYAEQRRVEVRLRDAGGELVAEKSRDATPMPDRNESRSIADFVLRPGTYAVAVALDGKDVLEASFEVPEGVDVAPDVTFTLP